MTISPIFITGAWRSGTTLLSRIINSHSDIHITFDTVHFLRFSYKKYEPINDFKNVSSLIRDTASRLDSRYNIKLDVNTVTNELSESCSYASIYNSIMKSLFLNGTAKTVWGEKTNLAWTSIPKFYEMYPEGRVIHIVRDPRAVLASWKKYTRAPGNDYLDSIVNCFDSMEKGLLYKDDYDSKIYQLITYEDLVVNPHETIESICASFSIDFSKKMLDTSLFTDNEGKAWKPNSIYNDEVSGISTALIGKWKTQLDDWEKYLVDQVMDGVLLKYNYSLSDVRVNDALLECAINKILDSKLAREGLLRFFLEGKGIERYPSNPTNPVNW